MAAGKVIAEGMKPDGLEFAAGTGIGVSMVGLSATQTAAAVGYGQIAIAGFEW